MFNTGRLPSFEGKLVDFSVGKADLMILTVTLKYNEVKENTIFELMQLTGCSNSKEYEESLYEIKIEQHRTDTIISLWHKDQHIISYKIYLDITNNEVNIKRDRKVNNLDYEEGGIF